MNKKNIIVLIIAIIIIWIGYAMFKARPTESPNTNNNTEQTIAIDPKNASYTIDDEEYTLIEGISEKEATADSASKTITKYFGNEVSADLNGDGANDVAFLLTQNSGGSGVFFYVAALVSAGNKFIGTNAILLGDRIAPQTTEFQDGEIVVNYADRKPGEPFTAQPSVAVSKYFTVSNNILSEVKNSDLIRVNSPKPNQVVQSPLLVTGVARGNWFFEASFPVVLAGEDGKIIAQGIATAKGEWMTTEFVPFEATLIFTADKNAYGNKATLILKKDNPSGLPEYDNELMVPVVLSEVQ